MAYAAPTSPRLTLGQRACAGFLSSSQDMSYVVLWGLSKALQRLTKFKYDLLKLQVPKVRG